MATYSLDTLWEQVERMKKGDMPLAQCAPDAYSNALSLSIDDMPKVSSKAYGLIMEALFAAYQLGQIHTKRHYS